jgi:hypothetical protein
MIEGSEIAAGNENSAFFLCSFPLLLQPFPLVQSVLFFLTTIYVYIYRVRVPLWYRTAAVLSSPRYIQGTRFA